MITIIVHRSAGNESVGSMWHETFHFDESATLGFVMKYIADKCGTNSDDIVIPVQRFSPEVSK